MNRGEANVAGINLQLNEYKREIDHIETKYKTTVTPRNAV
jgi:hypothetical protein